MGDLISALDLTKKPTRAQRVSSRRNAFDAAKVSRLSSGWTVRPQNTDSEIRESLTILRARSRNLAWNNDYAKRFLNLCRTNIVGHNGIGVQYRAKDPDGTLDEKANRILESAWIDWGKKGNCSANGKQSLLSFMSLAIVSLPTDGEVLIRRIKGFGNKHGFAVHQYDPDYLDVDLNRDLDNGNQIRMGVEVNKWGKPIAYHFLTRHPSDYLYNRATGPKKYDVVPANQISHFFIHERVNQTRGVPWLATPAERLYQLGGYEESELVASRTAASKMGFYTTGTGGEYDDAGELDDGDLVPDLEVENEEKAPPTSVAEPATFEELPEGWDFKTFDPQHPNSSFDAFVMAILRGVSAGLNISYVALSGDLRGVSYSSIRQGVLSDQDAWRMLQWLFIHECLAEINADWLECAFLAGTVSPLPIAKFDKFNTPKFQPRGWEWVDPLKEETANEKAIKNLTRPIQEIVASRGGDIYDIIDATKRVKAAVDKEGLKTPALHWWEEKELKLIKGGKNDDAEK